MLLSKFYISILIKANDFAASIFSRIIFHDKVLLHKMKIRTRNNLIHMLAGTKWGAGSNIFRIAVVALCYSVAVY